MSNGFIPTRCLIAYKDTTTEERVIDSLRSRHLPFTVVASRPQESSVTVVLGIYDDDEPGHCVNLLNEGWKRDGVEAGIVMYSGVWREDS
jgi:hypothetical protein